jgi:hypothetical protein
VARAQAAQDLKPIHSWQANIEHDQVERGLRGIAQCGFTIVSHDRIMAGFDQRGSDLSRQSNFIFNNQSAHKLYRLPERPIMGWLTFSLAESRATM